MKQSAAVLRDMFLRDFPKGTMPIDERVRKELSEADPHIKKIEMENRNWLVSYATAPEHSDDAGQDKTPTLISPELGIKRESPLRHFPHFKEWREGHFFSLRKWEGVVESVHTTSFIARLKDVDQEVPDERVEIDYDELTNIDEKSLVHVGAVFSWTMGYSITRSGTRRRQAILIFRRMPMWTEQDIRQGDQDADEMYAALVNNNDA